MIFDYDVLFNNIETILSFFNNNNFIWTIAKILKLFII